MTISYDGKAAGEYQSDMARKELRGSIWGAIWNTGNALISARDGAFEMVPYNANNMPAVVPNGSHSQNFVIKYSPDVPMGNEFKGVSMSGNAVIFC